MLSGYGEFVFFICGAKTCGSTFKLRRPHTCTIQDGFIEFYGFLTFSNAHLLPTACAPSIVAVAIVNFVVCFCFFLLPFYTSTVAVFYLVAVISIRTFRSFVRSFIHRYCFHCNLYCVRIDIDLVSKPYRLKAFFIACYFWIYTRSFICWWM